MIERVKPREARIGIFAVGHAKYWEQFAGLRESLLAFHEALRQQIEALGAQVVDFGLSDSSQAAYGIADRINEAHVDVLFCNMVTYATSATIAPIFQHTTAPMVLAALQPQAALDYQKANTYAQLQNDNICSVPEFCGVANRMGKKIQDVIIGRLHGDESVTATLREWVDIACVLHDLHGARLGLMGHVMEAMYDMHTDPTALAAAFGIHVPLLEIDDAVAMWEAVTAPEMDAKEALIRAEFEMPEPVSDPVTARLTDADLQAAARDAAALDRLVEKYHLTGLAYYYEGQNDSIQRQVISNFIVGNSILNAQGVPMCGEYDIKTLVAMLIMDRLNIGGSFAEMHPFDFAGNFILVGHDGPHHIAIADGKPILRSLKKFHGKPGSGASVEFKIKEGEITMLGITQDFDGQFRFVIGEGFSEKGAIPPTGNTNTRAHFPPDTRAFVKRWVMSGPTHHFALGVGHCAQTIQKIANVLGIRAEIIR